MVDTARTLITNALLDLGVLADEETPTASQAAGGLRKLNNMLDAWNIQSYAVYGALPYVLPLTSGVGSYTIGTGGTFNIPRPTTIQSAYLRNNTSSPPFDSELYIMDDAEWQDVAFKTETATMPFRVYFDWTYPYVTMYLNPIPTGNYSLVLWVSGLLSNLTLDGLVSFPPGYTRALEANLAVELAASYGVQVPETISYLAQSSMEDIKVKNFKMKEMQLGRGAQFNIFTGRYIV